MDNIPLSLKHEYYESVKRKNMIDSMKLEEEAPTALDVQVGGGHYKDFTIQPVEFCEKNQLSFCQGNVVKYVTRFKDKNGIEDLRKASHYLSLLALIHYGEEL